MFQYMQKHYFWTLKWELQCLYTVLGCSLKCIDYTTLQYNNHIFTFTIPCNPCKVFESLRLLWCRIWALERLSETLKLSYLLNGVSRILIFDIFYAMQCTFRLKLCKNLYIMNTNKTFFNNGINQPLKNNAYLLYQILYSSLHSTNVYWVPIF